jgi:hypothetical protein
MVARVTQKVDPAMKYYTDGKRHLVCVPYSIANLHAMADELNIKRCWFHKDHYDIPKRRIEEIEARCQLVSSKTIIMIIQLQQYGLEGN